MRGKYTRLPAEAPPKGGESAEAIVFRESGRRAEHRKVLKTWKTREKRNESRQLQEVLKAGRRSEEWNSERMRER